METTKPYKVTQIALELQHTDFYFSFDNESGYYCLFWWKNILLGHLFIENNEPVYGVALRLKILKAIEPAIEFYKGQQKIQTGDYKNALLEGNFIRFSSILNIVFSDFTTPEYPEYVDISLIICTRNRSKDLKRCLEWLQDQISRPKEIIVVDNAPSDNSTFNVVKQFANTVYYKEPRGGLSIARNSGLQLAKYPVIAFTDDDVLPHPLWLYRIWETFQVPQIAAMTGLVIASTLETESQQLFEKEWSFNSGFVDKIYDQRFFLGNMATGPRVWDIGAGANMAFRKSVFRETGYFDERLGAGAAGCSEDSEMWYRILARGYDIGYNPRAIVFHEHRKELKALHKQIFSYMRGHAAAALIQQKQIKEAGYKKYLYQKITKSYLPLLVKNFFKSPFQQKIIVIQLMGLFSGILFFLRNRKKPSQSNIVS